MPKTATAAANVNMTPITLRPCLICNKEHRSRHDICRSCYHSEPDSMTPDDWRQLEDDIAEQHEMQYMMGEW